MEKDNPTLGMSREQKQRAQDEWLSKLKKVYANGIFHIVVPVKSEDVPEEELEFLKQQSKLFNDD